jgi:4-amino-4-deoxy-L-arabinose transferase-like glycosyltransferase
VEWRNFVTHRPWLVLLVMSAAVLLPRLGAPELRSPDEPRFSLIVQDIYRGEGTLVVPHLDGKIYSEKPPLQLWAVWLASLPFGRPTEWSARIPSTLAAIGLVLLTGWLGGRLFGRRAGFISALVLLTTSRFFDRARWCCTDMILSLFVVLAIGCAYRWTCHDGAPPRRGLGWAFFAAAGLATLTKGPVGVALPVGILVAYLVVERRWREVFRFPWITGALIYLAVVVPWYLLYGLQGGWHNLWMVVLRENVNRYLNAWNNVHPFYYYLGIFPLSFLPWAVFLPATLVAIHRRRHSESRAALTWCAVWFLVIFVFFSISSGKRTVYLLPLFPAAALLVGWFFDAGYRALPTPRFGIIFAPAFLWSLIVGLAGIGLPILVGRIYRPALPPAAVIGAILVASGVFLGFHAWRRDLDRVVAVTCAGMLAAEFLCGLWLLPVLGGYENVRHFSQEIVRAVPQDAQFATAIEKREALLFYTGLRGEMIRTDADMVRILGSGQPAYCVVPGDDWDRVGKTGVAGKVVLSAPVTHYPYVVVSNMAGAPH